MAKCKKLLAILLTLAMIVGMLPMSAIMTSAAIDKECVRTFNEDFEDPTAAAENFTTLQLNDTAKTPTAAEVVEEEANNYFKPTLSSTETGYIDYISAIKDGTPTTASFKIYNPANTGSYTAPGRIATYYNPSTGEQIAETPCCTQEEVDAAIAAAKAIGRDRPLRYE